MSDAHNLTICLAAPTRQEHGVYISMLLFQSNVSPKTFSKQLLHSDELLYFTPGKGQLIFTVKGIKVPPAMCYESFQTAHTQRAHDLVVQLYVASFAKSKSGIEEASAYYLKIAETLGMSVALVDGAWRCDGFEGAAGAAF
ncbi:MAG: putative amidohydrolase [Flavobacteriales bacterium]